MALPSVADLRALLRAFWEDGYKYIQWHRMKDGNLTLKKLRTKP